MMKMIFDTSANYTNKCRVCLEEGKIPMYGKNGASIGEAVKLFGDIDITENHRFPRYLCMKCLSILKDAIAFRKQARKTDDLLKQLQSNFRDDCNLSDCGDVSQPPEIHQQRLQTGQSAEALSQTRPTQIKIKSNSVQCTVCEKTISRYHYKSHLKTIHDIGDPLRKRATECTICKESVKNMRQHMLDTHGIVQTNYICDVCGKQFNAKQGLNNHILIHCDSFAFKCQLCPYRARKRDTLKVHIKSHTREYKYQCPECPKRFQTASNRSIHMRKHKEPMFKCDMCSRAFHTLTIKERHYQADHMGIKDFVCNFCQKGFGTKGRLTKHELKVHKREKRKNGKIPAYLTVQQKTLDAENV